MKVIQWIEHDILQNEIVHIGKITKADLVTHTPWLSSDMGTPQGFAPSQWETVLLCNDVSHWLGANLESALLRKEIWLVYYHRNMPLGKGDNSLTCRETVNSKTDEDALRQHLRLFQFYAHTFQLLSQGIQSTISNGIANTAFRHCCGCCATRPVSLYLIV